jgi:hypothetical protein
VGIRRSLHREKIISRLVEDETHLLNIDPQKQDTTKKENDLRAGLGAAALAAGVTLWGTHLTWEISAVAAVAANVLSTRNDSLGEVVTAAGNFVAKVYF